MNCSGRGVVIGEGCVCFDGWTSVGDLRIQTGLDCDVSIVFIRVMFSFGILFCLISGFLSISKLFVNEGTMIKVPKLKLLLIALLSILFLTLFILKVSDPVQRVITLDYLTTCLFCFSAITLFVFTANVLSMLLDVTERQRNLTKFHFLRFAKIFVLIECFAMCCCQTLPLVILYYRGNSELSEELVRGFWITQSSILFVLAILMPMIVHPIIQDLSKIIERSTHPTKEVEATIKRLEFVKYSVPLRALINASITMSMGVTDFRYWSPYLYTLQAFFFPLILIKATTLFLPKKRIVNEASKYSSSKAMVASVN